MSPVVKTVAGNPEAVAKEDVHKASGEAVGPVVETKAGDPETVAEEDVHKDVCEALGLAVEAEDPEGVVESKSATMSGGGSSLMMS